MAQNAMTNAIDYLSQVKQRFAAQPELYRAFLRIMQDFKTQDCTVAQVVERVTALLSGHPDLIEGFSTFLPPGQHQDAMRNPPPVPDVVYPSPFGNPTPFPPVLNPNAPVIPNPNPFLANPLNSNPLPVDVGGPSVTLPPLGMAFPPPTGIPPNGSAPNGFGLSNSNSNTNLFPSDTKFDFRAAYTSTGFGSGLLLPHDSANLSAHSNGFATSQNGLGLSLTKTEELFKTTPPYSNTGPNPTNGLPFGANTLPPRGLPHLQQSLPGFGQPQHIPQQPVQPLLHNANPLLVGQLQNYAHLQSPSLLYQIHVNAAMTNQFQNLILVQNHMRSADEVLQSMMYSLFQLYATQVPPSPTNRGFMANTTYAFNAFTGLHPAPPYPPKKAVSSRSAAPKRTPPPRTAKTATANANQPAQTPTEPEKEQCESDSDDEKRPRTTLLKRKKDPNAPKRNKNAYMFFAELKRQQINQETPGLLVRDVISKIGQIWKEMGDAERQPFVDLAERDKERYLKELAEYNSKI